MQRGTQFLWPTERQLAFNCGTASNDGCVSWVHKLVLNVNKCLSINWCFMGIVGLLVVSRNGSESMTSWTRRAFERFDIELEERYGSGRRSTSRIMDLFT